MELKMCMLIVAVIAVFGIISPSLSEENILDLFPEFANLKQKVHTTETNVQSLQTAVNTLQQPKPLCQYGVLEKQYGKDYASKTVTFTFNPAFTHTPAVAWGFDSLDNDASTNLRVKVSVLEHNQYRLKLKLYKWGDTELWQARLRWIACPKTI